MIIPGLYGGQTASTPDAALALTGMVGWDLLCARARQALAAWSVIKERHGLVKVTIRELRDPAGLQKPLRAAGGPANVRFVHHFFQPPNSVHLPKGCLAPQMSDKAVAN